MIPIANPELDAEEKERVLDVLDSGMLVDGPEVRGFEEEFAEFCESRHAVATTNGTTALHTAFQALGLGEDDRVLTTPFSFIASANAIRFAGAEPVFADIDPETYNLDPHAVERLLRNGLEVDAVLVVHLFGLPAEITRFRELAEEYDLLLVEDAAQSHGAEYRGERVGSFGDAACFSFYPTKNMTTGEGGMVTTSREDVAERAASFINHGRDGSAAYSHTTLGHNFRMTSIAAAIGRVQLERLPAYNEARRENASRLTRAIKDTDIVAPTEPDHTRHVYHQYTVRTDDRDELRDHLERDGIGTGTYYPSCITDQRVYRNHSADVPVADRTADQVLSLPVHPNVSKTEIRTIAKSVRSFGDGQ